MAEAADKDCSAQAGGFFADAPVGLEFRGEGREGFDEGGSIERQGGAIDGETGEEPAVDGIGELMDLEEIAAMERDEGGEPGKEADAVRAGEFQEGNGHVPSVSRRGDGRKRGGSEGRKDVKDLRDQRDERGN